MPSGIIRKEYFLTHKSSGAQHSQYCLKLLLGSKEIDPSSDDDQAGARLTIRRIWFLFLALSVFGWPFRASADNPALAAGTASSAPGSTVTVPISFTSATVAIAAFQFSISVPAGWSIVSASAGAAATAASKSVSANTASRMLIMFGVDQRTVATGVVAYIQIAVPASAESGIYPVTIAGPIFSASDGSSVQPAASTAGSVTVQSNTKTVPTINSFTADPASISAGNSTTLSWSVSGATSLSISTLGTVTGSSVVVSPAATTTYTLTANNSAGSAAAITTVTVDYGALRFIPTAPCRLVDTRNPNGAFGGPELAANSVRNFDVPNSSCNIPTAALAYSLNVTVVPRSRLSYLTLWPTGQVQPYVSTLNSDGRIKANAAIVPAGTNGAVSVYATDTTQLILDIDGYFVPTENSASLAFYPIAPCRIADTRQGNGPLTGPFLSGGAAGRSFPILSSSCNLPAAAQAYSMNITAVPHEPLRYITVWPTGKAQPLASTLNANTGAVTANADLVSAGTNGNISVYASEDTDLLIDVNGYFAAPGSGGLSLYTVVPCRVLDTRNPQGASPLDGTLPVNVGASPCAISTTAQAFILNATAVPTVPLQYLTVFPYGQTEPVVSTLNASDGAITSNMAVVPSTGGWVDVFGSNPTYLVVDISSYFAP